MLLQQQKQQLQQQQQQLPLLQQKKMLLPLLLLLSCPVLLFNTAAAAAAEGAATVSSRPPDPAHRAKTLSHVLLQLPRSLLPVPTRRGDSLLSVSLNAAASPSKFSFLAERRHSSQQQQQQQQQQLAHAVKSAFYAYPLFENQTHKLHIHREGQKNLIADLLKAGAFELDVHPDEKQQWQFMNSLAHTYLQERGDSKKQRRRSPSVSAFPSSPSSFVSSSSSSSSSAAAAAAVASSSSTSTFSPSSAAAAAAGSSSAGAAAAAAGADPPPSSGAAADASSSAAGAADSSSSSAAAAAAAGSSSSGGSSSPNWDLDPDFDFDFDSPDSNDSSSSFSVPTSTPLTGPLTWSILQAYLDHRCALMFSQTTAAAARLLKGDSPLSATNTDSLLCVPLQDMDLQQQGLCLDVCLKPFECTGSPVSIANAKPLNIDKAEALEHWCTTSELHRRVQRRLCGDKALLRLYSGAEETGWLCLIGVPDYQQVDGLRCIGACGETVDCLSPASPILLTGSPEVVQKYIQQEMPTGCSCNEGTIGAAYAGCQSTTRLGKKCQQWSSQFPHKHDVLTGEQHNFCRAAGQGEAIWCFTTDPDVRSDFCDPLGPKTQLVRPSEYIDIVLEGSFMDGFYDLSFFKSDGSEGDSPCGVAARETNEIYQDGRLSALVFKDIRIDATAQGSYAVCLCDHSYYIRDSPICTQPEHYTFHAGWLHVKGPSSRLETFDMETGVSASISLFGFGYTKEDSVSITRASYSCDMSAFAFAESMGSLLLQGPEAYRQLAFALQLGTATAAKLSPTTVITNRNLTTLYLPEFTFYQTGVYYACWAPAGYTVSLPAAIINVSGVELRRHFYALFVSNSATVGDRPFSLFIKARGTVSKPASTDIYLVKRPPNEETGTDAACGGSIVGRPSEVVEQQTAEDAETKYFIAEQMTVTRFSDSDSSSEGTLEVCLETNGKTLSLGVAHSSRALVYSLEMFQRGPRGPPPLPTSTFSMTIPKFSSLGLHWIGAAAETDCFVERDLHAFFSQGDFPKALSFWVEEGGVSVWHSSHSNPAPTALAFFEIEGVSAVAVHANSSRVLFFVLRTQLQVLEVYDMTNPTHLNQLSPLATTAGGDIRLLGATSLALLQGDTDCRVLLADRHRKQLLLFSSSLLLLEAKSVWPGMTGPLEGPRSVYCIPTPDSNSSFLFDCYFADQDSGRLILVQYDTEKNSSAFVSEVASSENGAHKLVEPKVVVVYAYKGYTLLYAAEEGKTEPMLLTKPYGHSEMRLYQRLDSVSAGETDIRWMCLLQTGDASGGLSGVWLTTFHDSPDGPMVHLVPLDTTATTPDFKYTPREWYALGEEHRLEPSIVGASSNTGLTSFALNPAAASFAFMKRNVTIEEATGAVTLRLIDIQEEPLTVEVIGSGVVNSVNTSFTFRVGCKDGHYYHKGMCIKCQTGSFNSLALVKESPNSYFHACRKCAEKRSTVAEGSTSNEQCLCAKGYHLDKDSDECVPCPEGSYKDTVADTGCTGGGCPPHSVSHVVGAISSADRLCSW
ncbi:hypothetical protein EBH_0038040 [Eimeria brunetti]|uniref:Kringle domain-containing protein n=1 Tax=Eimeria brunetti TaxID=51314 RepID=U6LKW8_9EIME|nr:hypothetical protein EBH_0038040 [Eimeria brunetti]